MMDDPRFYVSSLLPPSELDGRQIYIKDDKFNGLFVLRAEAHPRLPLCAIRAEGTVFENGSVETIAIHIDANRLKRLRRTEHQAHEFEADFTGLGAPAQSRQE